MMKNSISENVQNLSSRKLWSILNGSNDIQLINGRYPIIQAAEKELIARKEYSKSNRFHQPH